MHTFTMHPTAAESKLWHHTLSSFEGGEAKERTYDTLDAQQERESIHNV